MCQNLFCCCETLVLQLLSQNLDSLREVRHSVADGAWRERDAASEVFDAALRTARQHAIQELQVGPFGKVPPSRRPTAGRSPVCSALSSVGGERQLC